jgi:O-antigen ligase
MDARLVLKAWQEFHQALWAAGLRMVVDKPAFGQGPGTFYSKVGHYYRPGDEGEKPRHENAHNYFVQVAAETGIFGLAGFLWCVGIVMVPGFTRASIEKHSRTRLLAIGAGGYLFTALAQHPLVLSEQAFLFWGYLGILGACARLNRAPPTASRPV